MVRNQNDECGYFFHTLFQEWELGQLVGKSAGLIIKRLRVSIPAEAAGEFSSAEFTLCTDSYLASVPSLCYHSGTYKTPVIVPKVHMAGYT